MASSAIVSPATKQTITGAHAERILCDACDAHVALVLRASSWTQGQTVSAILESLDSRAVAVRVNEADLLVIRAAGVSLEASFTADGQSFCFLTSVLAHTDESDVVRLVRPTDLAVQQRRRTQRHRFARTQVVEVRDPSGGDLLCTATLLNLSPDGIAARTADPLTDRCQGGQSCRVRFCLDDDAPVFELPATITNVTPAGAPGHSVLGMEFLHDGMFASNRARISSFLATLTARATEGRS